MGSQLTKVIANFQTTLAADIAVGGLLGTLSTGLTKEGVALPDGTYCMVVNQGQSTEQHMIFTLTGGTAMSNIVGVDHSGNVTAGALKIASINDPIKLTDFVNLLRIVNILNGISTLDGTSPLKYDAEPTFSDRKQLIDKGYADDILIGLLGTASLTTFGSTKMTKNQSSKPRTRSTFVREQDTPDMTLKVESFRTAFVDRTVNFAGGTSPSFINPGFGGDLAMPTNNPSNGEQFVLTVNGTACTFTFVSSIGATAGNVLIGGSVAVTRANLAALINAPGVTTANGVAFTGAALTALGLVNCTDDLSTGIFVRAISSTVTTFSATESMVGAGNTWTANTTKNRLDLLVLDGSNTLQIRKGSEAVSPTVPTPTSGDIVLVSVYNIPGETSIKDATVALAGYITEWYDLSVYRTDLLSTTNIPLLSMLAGAAITTGNPVSLYPFQSDGGILVDTSGASGNGSTGQSITIASNSNRAFLLFASPQDQSTTLTGTFAGSSLTQIASSNDMFAFILVAPTTGSQTLLLNKSCSYTYYSLYNVKQTGTVEAFTTSLNASSGALSNISDGAMVFGSIGSGGDNIVTYNISGQLGFAGSQNGGGNLGKTFSAHAGQVFGIRSVSGTFNTGGFGNNFIACSIAAATVPVIRAYPSSAATPTLTQFANLYQSYVGVAQNTVALGGTVNISTFGTVTVSPAIVANDVGRQLYLSDTSATLSQTAGTNSRKAGISISTTQMVITNNW